MTPLHPHRRIIWLILDGLGFRHWKLVQALDPSAFPAMTRFTEEGLVIPCEPSWPVCQTPPALFTLLSGESPLRHGVWGYRMPAYGRFPFRSMSGFSVKPLAGHPIWDDLEERGLSYSLMNVAFRNDRVWKEERPGLEIAFDGYRTLQPMREFRLREGTQAIRFRGIELRVRAHQGDVEIRKGGRRIAYIDADRPCEVALTRGTRAFAFLPEAETLYLVSANQAAVRGTARPMGSPEFLDAQLFRTIRNRFLRQGRPVRLEREMAPAALSFALQRDIALEILDRRRTSLSVLYISLIDSMNHAYMDAIDSDWPEGRGSEVLKRCFALVDGLMTDLFRRCGPEDLLVVSSDHGAVPFHRTFHVNELFSRAGLLPKEGLRFQFPKAVACYHPSECGQVLYQERAAAAKGLDRARVLSKVREILQQAEILHDVRLGMVEAPQGAPWLSLLYPMDDANITAKPSGSGGSPLLTGKSGGHHDSPLCPSPWIQSILGVWGPDRKRLPAADLMPTRSEGVKAFLLDLLDGLTSGDAAVKSE
jgi:hypothetical protein